MTSNIVANLLRAFSIALALVVLPLSALSASLTGRVIGIQDGDTITVLDASNTQHKIRLAGIDAPESKQAFGNRSKQNLSGLVYKQQVTVEWKKRDRYQRIVGIVFVNGNDANLLQVQAGMAWWYRQYSKEQSERDRERYEAAEEGARVRKRGLWADKTPIPPWEWRRQLKR